MVLVVSLLKYGSSVSGTIQGKEYHPPQHLGVVAIENGSLQIALYYSRPIYLLLYIIDRTYS